ncbi:MAG: beta-galactosidase [Patescibacteria group bacterium]
MTRREFLIASGGSLLLPNGQESVNRAKAENLQIRVSALQHIRIGASFTISHAMWLNGSWGGPLGNNQAIGPPWQDSLKEIANSGVSTIRLSMPWDLVEPAQGKFNWRELDEALQICEQAAVEVVLCFGAKSPRYPEYHPPTWIKAEVEKRIKPPVPSDALQIQVPDKAKQELAKLKEQANKDPAAAAILKTVNATIEQSKTVMAATPKARAAIAHYLTEGIKRYRDRTVVVAWQIENEPLTFTRPMALSQVRREIALARSLDLKKRPILATTWTAVDVSPDLAQGWSPVVTRQMVPLGDILGFDCYVKSNKWETQPEHWRLISRWMDHARGQGKRVWITEWQAEPWEGAQKMDFKNPNGNVSFNPTRYLETFPRAIALKPEKIFLWGLEFQIACKHQGNDAWWKATQEIIAKY